MKYSMQDIIYLLIYYKYIQIDLDNIFIEHCLTIYEIKINLL